jgi:flagellin-like protein
LMYRFTVERYAPFRRGKPNMRYTETKEDSAVSPVIGVILMVAITVILAAVIGTFVLGLGENVDGTTSAGVSIDQTAGQSFSVNVVDTGNLDTAGIVGPDGTRSAFASTDDLLASGAVLRVADNANWDRKPQAGLLEGNTTAASAADGVGLVLADGGNTSTQAVTSASGLLGAIPSSGAVTTPGGDELATAQELSDLRAAIGQNGNNECYVSHGANVVSGVQVSQAAIGCTGLALSGTVLAVNSGTTAPPAAFPATIEDSAEAAGLSTGSAITYEAGAEYSFVGTVDGSENVVQSFETEEE